MDCTLRCYVMRACVSSVFSEQKVDNILYSQLPRSAKLGVNNVSKLTPLDMCSA